MWNDIIPHLKGKDMNQKQRDLLCKMLDENQKTVKRQLNDHYPVFSGRYSIGEEMRDKDSPLLGVVGSAIKTRCSKIVKKIDEHDKHRETLHEQKNVIIDQLETICDEQRKKKEAAVSKLASAFGDAVVQIQFAEDAEQAKAILGSLPTMDQLIK